MNYQQLISQPTLLLDEQKCQQNIAAMCDKADRLGISLRPHFKTHQSRHIGNWFKAHGINKITVSSLTMAEYFAADWDDICIAFPVNLREIDAINQLASNIKLTVVVANMAVVEHLLSKLTGAVNVMIKIDAGYHRCGVEVSDYKTIEKIVSALAFSTKTNFHGFLSHSGHTYRCRNSQEVALTNQQSLQALVKLKQHFAAFNPQLSYGDTPSFSTQTDFPLVDELRPGNAVFYDLSQVQIGSCKTDQVAVAVACPIVAKYPARNELVVCGGAVHLSKDVIDKDGTLVYGLAVLLTENGWSEPLSGCVVKSLSQEHGILSLTNEYLQQLEVGDLIGILPAHSCLTADIHSEYLTFSGQKISKFRTY